MSKTTNRDTDGERENRLYDMGGNLIEISPSGGMISLFAWTITEDSWGNPHETRANSMELTPRKAVELAYRLFAAATE